MPESRPDKSTNVRLSIARALGRVASLSPSLGARLLEHVFLSTRRHPSPERERAWLERAEEFSFESLGRRLGACIVTFDGPGHGRSPGRRSSLVEMGAAVLDAVRALGPVHGVIAHSAGAAATTLALRDGAPIERLVYVAPPADLGEFLGPVATALGLPADAVLIARHRIEKRFGFRWETIAHVHLAQSMTAPLLVIHDDDDREIDVDNGVRLASSWRQSRLEVTSGLGHRRILRDQGVVSRAVGFLAADGRSHAGMVGTALAPSAPSSAEARTTRSFPPVFAR
jgi:pimeloyl-ACP methyl ester carboxylesterase